MCGFDIVQSNKAHRCFSNQLFITGCCSVWTWFIVYALSWSPPFVGYGTLWCILCWQVNIWDVYTSQSAAWARECVCLIHLILGPFWHCWNCAPGFEFGPPYTSFVPVIICNKGVMYLLPIDLYGSKQAAITSCFLSCAVMQKDFCLSGKVSERLCTTCYVLKIWSSQC